MESKRKENSKTGGKGKKEQNRSVRGFVGRLTRTAWQCQKKKKKKEKKKHTSVWGFVCRL
jgi:hypothetical protein